MPQLQSETWVMTQNFKYQAETPQFLNRSPSLVFPTELLVIVLKEERALVGLVIPFTLRRKLLLLYLVSEMVAGGRAALVSFAVLTASWRGAWGRSRVVPSQVGIDNLLLPDWSIATQKAQCHFHCMNNWLSTVFFCSVSTKGSNSGLDPT